MDAENTFLDEILSEFDDEEANKGFHQFGTERLIGEQQNIDAILEEALNEFEVFFVPDHKP